MANPLNNRDKSQIAELAKTDDLLDEIPEEEEIKEEEEEVEEDLSDKGDFEHPQKEKPQIEQIDEDELDEAEEEVEEETEDKQPKKTEGKETPTETPDINTRYQEQRREAQLLHERNKQLTDAFLNADEVKEPTEEELIKYVREKGAAWDELTVVEKGLFKDNLTNSRRLEAVQGAVRDVKNIDEWASKVDRYLDTNERKQSNKQLIGKESDFRAFAMQSSHRGIPIDILTSHFLMTSTKPAERKPARSLPFATQQGGTREKTKSPNKVTDVDQIARLRTTEEGQKNLKRMLLKGQIDVQV